MTSPSISVLTVTHRRIGVLLDKVAAMKQQTIASDRVEWIVVANGDAEAGAPLRGADTPFRTVVLETPENVPIGDARNLAAERATSDVLLMSDDDCLPNPRALEGHLLAHRRYGPDTVVIAPLRLPEELRVGQSREPFERALRVGRRALWINATGANTSLPRSAFEAVGGYDASFVEYGGEDPDLALRLRAFGARFRSEPSAWAYHVGRVLGQDLRKAYLAGAAHRRIYERERSLEVGLLLGVHPWMRTLKRWFLGGPWSRVMSEGARAYERAYLEGASSIDGRGLP